MAAAKNPAKSLARASSRKTIPKAEAQERVLDMLAGGAKVEPAMRAVGRTEGTYRTWMEAADRDDPDSFRSKIRALREAAGFAAAGREPLPDFPEFCARYLHQPLPLHQLRVWDVMNGREPRDYHPSIRYHRGRDSHLLINMPPEHAKSTVWTINYPTWRLYRDPTIRIVIVSQGQPMARKFLHAIKQRLTGRRYQEAVIKFAPEDSTGKVGWRDPDGSWTRTEIYVAGADAGEKDPTVQVLGVGGQIYGARADLIICDDLTDLKTAARWPQIMDYISQDVDSRIGKSGQLIIVNTRVAPEDLSKHLRDDLVEFDGTPVFTYLAQPAVLDYAETSAEWTTLWPEAWPGPDLAKKRAMQRDESRFALVFQQLDVEEDAVFPPEALQCAVNRRRAPGAMSDEGWGTRPEGMRGLYVVGGLDPATVGHTAALVFGVERSTKRRYLLDGFDLANCSPDTMMEKVKELTVRLGVKTWVIERNAFQRFLTQLDAFRQWMYARGVRLVEHYTDGGNKFDSDFGVQAMAGLYLSCGKPRNDGSALWDRTPDTALIELPTPRLSRVTSLLLEQLATWHPTEMRQRQQTDLVMAHWFAEIEMRRWLGTGRERQQFLTPQGATRGDLGRRTVINLNELAAVREAEKAGVA